MNAQWDRAKRSEVCTLMCVGFGKIESHTSDRSKALAPLHTDTLHTDTPKPQVAPSLPLPAANHRRSCAKYKFLGSKSVLDSGKYHPMER